MIASTRAMIEESTLMVAPGARLDQRSASPNALLRANVADAFTAEPIALDRKATSAQALFVIASSCLRQVALNQPGVLAGSREAVHQMRVGLRRLRAALSIFEPALRPAEFDEVKCELVWLTGQLGAAREYDVLLEAHRKFTAGARAERLGEAELNRELMLRRHEAIAVAMRAVDCARFERLLVSTAVVLLARSGRGDAADRPVRDLARRALKHRARRVLEGLAAFEQSGARERHELRIRVKKLRYGTEYFASLFPNSRRARKRFVGVLEELQDALGKLNDIAVLRGIAATWVDEGSTNARVSPRTAFAMGVFTQHQQAAERSCLAEVAALRAKLAGAPQFWR